MMKKYSIAFFLSVALIFGVENYVSAMEESAQESSIREDSEIQKDSEVSDVVKSQAEEQVSSKDNQFPEEQQEGILRGEEEIDVLREDKRPTTPKQEIVSNNSVVEPAKERILEGPADKHATDGDLDDEEDDESLSGEEVKEAVITFQDALQEVLALQNAPTRAIRNRAVVTLAPAEIVGKVQRLVAALNKEFEGKTLPHITNEQMVQLSKYATIFRVPSILGCFAQQETRARRFNPEDANAKIAYAIACAKLLETIVTYTPLLAKTEQGKSLLSYIRGFHVGLVAAGLSLAVVYSYPEVAKGYVDQLCELVPGVCESIRFFVAPYFNGTSVV